MAGSSAWRESLSRWQKLKANKMPSVEFCTERTARGIGVVSVSFTAFMVGVSRETKSPATFSGAGLKKTGFKLFSFALPAPRPYQDGIRVFNKNCAHDAIRKNGNLG